LDTQFLGIQRPHCGGRIGWLVGRGGVDVRSVCHGGRGLVLLLARAAGRVPGRGRSVWCGSSPLLIAWLSARPQLVDYVGVLLLVVLLVVSSTIITRWSDPADSVLSRCGFNLHAGRCSRSGLLAPVRRCCSSGQQSNGGTWCLAATAQPLPAHYSTLWAWPAGQTAQ